MSEILKNYPEAIQAIKSAILKSRYRAAAMANRELLSLYYGIGEYISVSSRKGTWGTNAIEVISDKLQKELPGLRGFSATNMKNMRIFFEAWVDVFSVFTNRPSVAAEMTMQYNSIDIQTLTLIRQPIAAELTSEQIEQFFSIGFTHHREILFKTKSFEERIFYIERCALEFWSKETLRYHLKSQLFTKQGKLLNNFQTAISDKDLQQKALLSFKDEYLLDYINIESPDEEPDERVLESEIVHNIRKFIMSLGRNFSFIGNQYRMMVDEKEYFVDLLFYNRQLQSLVAFDLKRGDFKPEYLGKMNFYLSALDDLVRLPHENHSIGIILCKSKKQKTVEYAFRDTTKPMGVATFKTASELPPEYRNVLPDAEKLKELL
ncbi:MAG: PDDEXK nuclease domain-containing protein [Prevotellaceae bacterium]|jgi:predicted nuclease of restriction endonuclease-like (RecB) superfamily|nr:PDDEXK nuclease domain-containing protein [Prevotellaceae bacterium]